jgi:hypothetical protein
VISEKTTPAVRRLIPPRGPQLQGEPQDPSGRVADVGDEAADTLILLMSIVNRCGVNLE